MIRYPASGLACPNVELRRGPLASCFAIFFAISANDYGDDYDGRVRHSLLVFRSRRRRRQPTQSWRLWKSFATLNGYEAL